VPVAAAEILSRRVAFRPSAEALAVAQERLSEKSLLRELGIPTAHFAPIDHEGDVEGAIELTGLPAVIKTRRMGYDGKGQRGVRTLQEAHIAAAEMLPSGGLIAEEFVAFERELSLVGVRGVDGKSEFYPLVQNTHEHGILRVTLAPAPGLTDTAQRRAEAHARAVMERLNYVGVLTIEFFERDGELVANEMACRVHNSGHWTIEGAECSQFENHLRAILGWPLGATTPRACCAMVNIIGKAAPTERVLAMRGAHLHWYGKTPRPGRKLGHITLIAQDEIERGEMLGRLAETCA
jgi:5-(carboxyamino)imidazole ribonucleotide synthase